MSEPFYVHAIVPRETALPPELKGICDAPMRSIAYRALAAWGCSIVGEPSPTSENLVAHELTIEDIRALGPALPVRFGTVLGDERAVRHALEQRYDTLVEDLSRIGDKVEMGLTVLGPRANTTTMDEEKGAGPGARYLHARARTTPDALARDVQEVLGAHAIETRCAVDPSWPLVFRGSFLLSPERADAFRGAFERLRRLRPELRCLLSGPWPPYSFVT